MNSVVTDSLKTVAILDATDAPFWGDAEDWQRCAEALQNRIRHPVVLLGDMSSDQLVERNERYEQIVRWYLSQGFQRILILPCSILPFDFSVLTESVTLLRQGIQTDQSNANAAVYVCDPINLESMTSVLHSTANDAVANDAVGIRPHRPTCVLAGDSASLNSKFKYELAQIQQEWQLLNDDDLQLQTCFLGNSVPVGSNLHIASLLKNLSLDHPVVWIPWRIHPDRLLESLTDRLAENYGQESSQHRLIVGGAYPTVSLSRCGLPKFLSLMDQPAWMHLLLDRYLDGLSRRSIERYFSFPEKTLPKLGATMSEEGKALRELEQRIDAMLPSEYRGKTEEVLPTSMGSAGLHLDSEGRVAWDEIWTSFCDLALAGGPPHRGKLLESPSAEQVKANLESYRSVVAEIRRGVEMVTGLETQESVSLGWVGIVCETETMAAWLMRAIIVENIMVRREGNVLYVPAGPEFTIKKEVKNVITSVTKTVHYYRAHLRFRNELA